MQTDHRNRINKVFEHIDKNLDSDLSLAVVSEIACFSPFHFHRVFKTITGETLNEYVTRRRIEKAASVLIHNRSIRIKELSLQNGFDNNASFTRAFKKFYGVNPSKFRKENPNTFSKIRQLEGTNGQTYPSYEKYIRSIDDLKNWTEMNAKIEIKEVPALGFASITQIGVNGIEYAFERLIKWANSKDLLENPSAKLARIFHDTFKVTAPGKVRMSICLLTNEPFVAEGEIHKGKIKKGKCIVGRYEITPNDFERSWSGLFIWMNENGYKKAEENPFEIYHNDFRARAGNKFTVDLCIPIE